MPEYDNPPARGFEFLASEVASKNNVRVVYPAQTDTAFMWQSLGIHPLQGLETTHQRMVSEVGRNEPDPDKRMLVEREMLSSFFPFGAAAPAFTPTEMLGVKNPADDLFATRLMTAAKVVSTVARTSRGHRDAGDTTGPFRECKLALRDQALPHLEAIVAEYDRLRGVFIVPLARIPTLREAKRILRRQRVLAAKDWPELAGELRENLTPLCAVLKHMMTGLCSVQTFHVIGGFYLYRLMVRFRIESNEKVGDGTKRDVSADLTARLNDHEAWVIAWLKAKMRDVDAALQASFNDVHFHLKGGRALEYLKRRPNDGRNDWDTSVLLDPRKPPVAWYRQLAEIHNLLIRKLATYKMEFFVLAHLHADAAVFTQALPPPAPLPPPPGGDGDEAGLVDDGGHVDVLLDDFVGFDAGPDDEDWPLFMKEKAGCKAELIDIGIPRRDTTEALEHWHRTVPRIIRKPWTDGIPIPSHLYYIDEYILMIRDAFHSPMAKVMKRISRLYSILDLASAVDDDPAVNMAKVLEPVEASISGPIIPKIVKDLVKANSLPQAIRRLMTVQAHQFVSAYGLRYDGALAAAFDTLVSADAAGVPGIAATFPDSIKGEIKKATTAGTYDDATLGTMLRYIAFADAVSAKMERHFRDRARYFGFGWGDELGDFAKTRRRVLGGFVKALYTAGVFKQDEELEVQLAVGGSFAAFLHADYAMPKVSADLKDRLKAELDPVTTIEINLYTRSKSDPGEVLRALVLPALEVYVANPDTPNLGVSTIAVADDPHDPKNKSTHPELFIRWPAVVKMGKLEYCPVVARIRVVPAAWPSLSFVWGFPILSLPDLIEDYRHAAFEAEEYGAIDRCKKTAALLTAIHTAHAGDTTAPPTRAAGVAPTPVLPVAAAPDDYDPALDAGPPSDFLVIYGDDPALRHIRPAPPAHHPARVIVHPIHTLPDLHTLTTFSAHYKMLLIYGSHGDVDNAGRMIQFNGCHGAGAVTAFVNNLRHSGITTDCLVIDACFSLGMLPALRSILSPTGYFVGATATASGALSSPALNGAVAHPALTGARRARQILNDAELAQRALIPACGCQFALFRNDTQHLVRGNKASIDTYLRAFMNFAADEPSTAALLRALGASIGPTRPILTEDATAHDSAQFVAKVIAAT